MENLKMFVKKFNHCRNCGSGNYCFDIFTNNHPKNHDWCIQCQECGYTMMEKTLDELLENWNLDVIKEPDENEILKAENEKLKMEIERLKAENERLISYKKFMKENECLREENRRLFKVFQRSGSKNLSSAELIELSDKIKDARKWRQTQTSIIREKEYDRKRARELSQKSHNYGYLNQNEAAEFESLILSGALAAN